jgi:hypothetical protein
MTCGAGITAPFVTSLPFARSRAPTLLCRGGYDCRVVVTPSIPQGACSLYHGWSCLVGASSYHFSHGQWKVDQKHWKKKVTVRWNSWREMFFELSHENTGFKALHFHGKAKQFKVRLPLALLQYCIWRFCMILTFAFQLFKGTAAWDFACFIWPIYRFILC